MKAIKITMITLATMFAVLVASAFAPALSDSSITVQSVDGQSIGISLAPAQVKTLYVLLPEQYREMLDASYGRFRTKAVGADYGEAFNVDGIRCIRTAGEDGDIYVLSGVFDGRNHNVQVKVSSRDSFISQMDGIIGGGR